MDESRAVEILLTMKYNTILSVLKESFSDKLDTLTGRVNDFIDPERKKDLFEEIVKGADPKSLNDALAKYNQEEGVIVPNEKPVFIAHGRDTGKLDELTKFLRNFCKFEATVFSENFKPGDNVFSKFEELARESGYAIVLYTGCDKGGLTGDDPADYKQRARQNVVFELGYLVAKLGADKVCILLEAGTEIPSNASGLHYLEYSGDWKMDLLAHMEHTGLYKR